MAFLKNCWYAAIWADELKTGELAARTLLDTPLVLYRDDAGRPVAMDDMCPHRLAPLRLGKLLPGGTIQCGYHGLEFDSSGQCVKNPHGNGRVPRGCQVRTYPMVEKHTLAWIWMGNGEPDEGLIPDFGYLDADSGYDVGRRDTIEMDANYRAIIDNLLDLSHAAYLHDGLLGNAETAWADIEVRQEGPYVYVRRDMQNVPPPLLRDLLFKRDGAPVNMWQTIRWSAPSAVLNDVGTYAPDSDRTRFSGQLGCHILTPVSEDSTLYFTAAARQGPLGAEADEGEDALKARIAELRRYAFKEQDDPMLKAQQENVRRHPGVAPVLLPAIDAGPVRCQRLLDEMLRDESGQ
ncbi:Toluene-4-sulfonate monooxygenase system iron-sulfur subunit TsaM1 [Pigmentiphaga humi]|uniref:Toluene-4-sulfonate monooxygenase system iron-sulfur subunit TsaM1 n=1 Tax=Pigmentiphaga humi TaxID=2478468 RepID=A0A3P4B283_9BURK|nr:aromatic ring-hydroxylating dioxygenase subunit alpha [Pigmentiphaga humi]VCU69810.1 Toluene-4-sulfonate monooxygenase system iron-sulfur subunit TsaM1 [Pigmentiphaga humi]